MQNGKIFNDEFSNDTVEPSPSGLHKEALVSGHRSAIFFC